jgi:hypothetical protein
VRALTTGVLGGITVLVVTLGAPRAHAGDNDLVLARLGDNTTTPGRVIPDNAAFRSLVSELGVAMAPRLGTPADTIGWSSLQIATDYSFSTINGDEAYWRAAEGDSSTLGTFGVFVRKGISLPAPSLELTAGATHLTGSRLWTVQAAAKIALLEGFHGWAIPSIALRVGLARLLGTNELDLTTVSTDLSLSKTFAIADSVRLTPWAGWDVLWMVPRSGVTDKTPHIDAAQMPTDLAQNFTFGDQDTIIRQRLFLGAKLRYGVAALTVEAVFAFAGGSSDGDAEDTSGTQQTYTIGAALDF